MTRMGGGVDQVQVRPTSNVYTALLAVGVVAASIALIVVLIKCNSIGIKFF